MAGKPRGKPGRWRRAAGIAVMLLVVYPLSMGPAFSLMDATGDERVQKCVGIIYRPNGMVFYSSPYVQAAFLWYLGLWVSDDP